MFQSLPIFIKNSCYFFEPITGSLFVINRESQNKMQKILIPKLAHANEFCTQPYTLTNKHINKLIVYVSPLAIWYAKLLVWLCKHSFFWGRCFAKIGWSCFATTEEAICAFRQIFPFMQQDELCYPRTLFAASLSKTFKANGCIFIGIFLPSKSMHAWIIEKDTQPDPYDNMWINFQPVAALY